MARRNALGLHLDTLVDLLCLDRSKHVERENGSRQASLRLVDAFAAMESFVAATIRMLGWQADGAGPVVLHAYVDQSAFERAHPDAKAVGIDVHHPLALHDVAVGRAAAALTRAGHTVEVFRGDLPADLSMRRAAVGLTKNEAGPFFGLRKAKNQRFERSELPPPPGLIAESQKIDDIITAVGIHCGSPGSPRAVAPGHSPAGRSGSSPPQPIPPGRPTRAATTSTAPRFRRRPMPVDWDERTCRTGPGKSEGEGEDRRNPATSGTPRSAGFPR